MMITFVMEGEQLKKRTRNGSVGSFYTATNWVRRVDLNRQLNIHVHTTQSTLRPNILAVSEDTKQLILCPLGSEDVKVRYWKRL